jgi:hypothetical protein
VSHRNHSNEFFWFKWIVFDHDFSVFKTLSLERRIFLFIMWNFCSFDRFVITKILAHNGGNQRVTPLPSDSLSGLMMMP